MTEPPNQDDPRVADAIEEYLAALERGDPIDREEFLARHSEIAGPLSECLAGLELMDVAATGPEEDEAVAAGRDGTPGQAPVAIGDFRILREIGRGGMGVVYEAEQLSLGRRVALKVLPFAAVLDPRQLARFKTEAQAAAQLHHTNIVPVFAVGCDRGVHYYAMQYIEGQSLAAVIQDLRVLEGRLPQAPAGASTEVTEIAGSLATGCWAQPTPGADQTEDAPPQGDTSAAAAEESDPQDVEGAGPISRAVRTLASQGSTHKREFFDTVAQLGIQAAEGLQHAHEMGIVHRDVKPSNLMLDARGNLWLTDFGLASIQKSEASPTMPGDVLGTTRYMSPEQARARQLPVDHRTDVYSLGVTLYELLTLDHAFDGQTNQEILRKIAETEPRSPRRLNRSLPADLETIVLKAMAKEPVERYATAQELADDLRRFQADKPIRARRPSPLERASKWSRRHRSVVASAGIILVMAVVALAVSIAMITRAYTRESNQRGRAEENLQLAQRRGQEAEQQRDRAAELLAKSQLERGVRLLNEGNRWGLLDLLDARITADKIPGLRDSAARLWAIAHAQWADLLVHVAPCSHVLAFSPDGRLLATNNFERQDTKAQVLLWDLATGKAIGPPLELKGVEGVPSLTFSPDGRLLVTSRLGVARMWNTATGHPVGPVLGQTGGEAKYGSFRMAAFSPDGTLLAVGSPDGTVRVWEVATGEPHGKPLMHGPVIRSVAFSRDGKLLASGASDGTARLWVVATGQPHGPPLRHRKGGFISKVAFSPDGKLLVTGDRCQVALWKTQSGQLHKRFGDPRWPAVMFSDQAAFSPDGKLLATASTSWVVQLWDTATGKAHGKPLRHDAAVKSVAFSPDGELLVTGSVDKTVRLWDVATGKPRDQAIHHHGDAQGLFSPDGKLLATRAWDTTTRIWRIEPQLHVRMLPHRSWSNAVAFSPDSKHLATASQGLVRLWDAATGQPYGHHLQPGGLVTSLAFSPDARVLITGSRDGFARLWNPATGGLLDRQFRHRGPIDAMALSPDGKLLVTSSLHVSEIQYWQVTTGRAFRPASKAMARDYVRSLAFSPDGKLLARGNRYTYAGIWEVATGREYYKPRAGFTEGLAFSPDGKWLATASRNGTAKLWDVAGRRLHASLPHGEPAWAAAFSPDGTLLATAAGEERSGTVRLWEVGTGPPYHGLVLRHRAARGKVAFSPDGKFLASGVPHSRTRLWRLPLVPTDPEEMRLRTWIALGARRDPKSRQVTPIQRKDWLQLRQELRSLLGRRGTTPEPERPATSRAKDDAARRYHQAYSLQSSADRVRRDRPQEAVKANRKALALLERLAADYPNVPAYRYDLATIHRDLGASLEAAGKPAQAQEQYRQAAAVWRKLASDYPTIGYYRSNLAGSHTRLGESLAATTQPAQAHEQFRKAAADFLKAMELTPDNVRCAYNHALARLGPATWRDIEAPAPRC